MADESVDTTETDADAAVEDNELTADQESAGDTTESGGEDAGTEADGDGEPDPTDEKAIFQAKKRKLDAENKSLRDRLREKEEKLKKYEDAELSDKERLERDLGERDNGLLSLQAELNRFKVQKKFPAIDDDLIELISATDLDGMLAQAEKIDAKLAAKSAAPKKPAAKELTGGTDPQGNANASTGGPARTDYKALVADVKRY